MRTGLPTLLLCLALSALPPIAARADVADARASDASAVVPVDGPVAAAVRAKLQALSTDVPGTLEFELLGRPDAAPTGAGTTTVVGTPAGRWPRSRVAVPVREERDGALVKSRSVWVAVRWWREVDVYADDYAAGTPGDALRVETRRVDVAPFAAAPVALADAGTGMRLAHAVRAGRPLLDGDFEVVPDVRRGDAVRVEVERGAIRLAIAGHALADARVGETVTVNLGDERRPVDGRVISNGVVRIED